MTSEEKLALIDRLSVAKDIVINVKDDMKILADRNAKQSPKESMVNTYLAARCCDVAIEIGKLQQDVIKAEGNLRQMLEDIGG